MALSVAALIADGETQLDDGGCVSVSCPAFFDMLDALR
jgi:5-enolpyruvylshikimate-3-phosphate synthase